MRRLLLVPVAVFALLTAAAFLPSEIPRAGAQGCGFSYGFAILHERIPHIVGDCIGPEVHLNTVTSVQQTTNGQLVQVGTDHYVAFDAHAGGTYINEPCGVRRVTPQYSNWIAGGPCAQGELETGRQPVTVTPTNTPTITPTPTSTPTGGPRSRDTGSSNRTCESFASWNEAQAWIAEHPADRGNLDADGDGIACEHLPRVGF